MGEPGATARELTMRAAVAAMFMAGLVAGTAAAQRAPGLGEHEARGLIEAEREAVLSSEIAARVMRLPLKDGDNFAKDALLVALDCTLYDAQLAGARAQLKAADAKLVSDRALAKSNAIGVFDVALSEAEVEKARAAVSVAAVPASRCVMRAPFSGRVIERRVREHESVSAGQALLAVLDERNLEIRLVVPSAWLSWLKPGAFFSIVIDETSKRYGARLARLGARIDPVSQTVAIVGAFEGAAPDVVPGMSGTATFSAARH